MFLQKCKMERGIPFAMTVPSDAYYRNEAKSAIRALRADSAGEMSLEEIDAEIAAVRRERKARASK